MYFIQHCFFIIHLWILRDIVTISCGIEICRYRTMEIHNLHENPILLQVRENPRDKINLLRLWNQQQCLKRHSDFMANRLDLIHALASRPMPMPQEWVFRHLASQSKLEWFDQMTEGQTFRSEKILRR